MRKPVLLVPLLIASLACEKTGGSDADSDSPAAAAGRAQIDSTRNAWLAAAARDDAATVAGMYTEDAVFVATESPPVRGRAAIQAAFAESFPISTVDKVESKEIVVSGDVAYDYGEYTQTVTSPDGAAQTQNGHYLVILKRQADGSWKLTKHLSTTPPAAAAAPAGRTAPAKQ